LLRARNLGLLCKTFQGHPASSIDIQVCFRRLDFAIQGTSVDQLGLEYLGGLESLASDLALLGQAHSPRVGMATVAFRVVAQNHFSLGSRASRSIEPSLVTLIYGNRLSSAVIATRNESARVSSTRIDRLTSTVVKSASCISWVITFPE